MLRCASTTLQSATRLEQNTARLDNEYTCGRLNRLTAHYFGYELLAIGYWLLAMGYWLLGIGYGQLVIGYLIWAALSLSVPLHSTPYTLCSMLYTLRFTLYTKSDSDHASNLSPYRLIVHHLYALISLPAKGSVLTQMPQADAGAVRSSASQNHWSVRQNIIPSTEGR